VNFIENWGTMKYSICEIESRENLNVLKELGIQIILIELK